MLPINVEENFCLDNNPISNLAVVPEFLALSSFFGLFNPFIPLPVIETLSSIFTSTPICSTIFKEAFVSSLINKFLITDVPSAKAENKIALWDIDLSPIT